MLVCLIFSVLATIEEHESFAQETLFWMVIDNHLRHGYRDNHDNRDNHHNHDNRDNHHGYCDKQSTEPPATLS